MITRNTLTFSIANGQSLSGAVDLLELTPVRITMPSSWTAANLTFQVSYDGVNFANLYDAYGNEVIVQASTSRDIALGSDFIWHFLGAKSLRIRSGTSGSPVAQGGARTILVQAADL